MGLDGYNKTNETIQTVNGEFDEVKHELRKAFKLLAQGNPNVLVTLFNPESNFLQVTEGGRLLIENREKFLCTPNVYMRFMGFANSQLHRMIRFEYRGFMGDKRKKIVEKYGYDTKNAMTMIRLLDEGYELLTTGNLTIRKEGAIRQLLMDIKMAKYKLEDIQKMAEDYMFKLKDAKIKTVLHDKLDMEYLNLLLKQILEVEVFARHL